MENLEKNPNHRRNFLQERKTSGKITREEEAELAGLHAFPNNARGAHLLEKSILQTITKEEADELKKLHTSKYEK